MYATRFIVFSANPPRLMRTDCNNPGLYRTFVLGDRFGCSRLSYLARLVVSRPVDRSRDRVAPFRKLFYTRYVTFFNI
jgi:hypothetical protein